MGRLARVLHPVLEKAQKEFDEDEAKRLHKSELYPSTGQILSLKTSLEQFKKDQEKMGDSRRFVSTYSRRRSNAI